MQRIKDILDHHLPVEQAAAEFGGRIEPGDDLHTVRIGDTPPG